MGVVKWSRVVPEAGWGGMRVGRGGFRLGRVARQGWVGAEAGGDRGAGRCTLILVSRRPVYCDSLTLQAGVLCLSDPTGRCTVTLPVYCDSLTHSPVYPEEEADEENVIEDDSELNLNKVEEEMMEASTAGVTRGHSGSTRGH